jgi:cytochrome c oxidase cbb3-type subunit 3
MSDFVSGFWNIYVMAILLVSILGCGIFLWMQSSATHATGQTTGHVWDETLEEYSNPLPNWWRWLFYITIVFALGYLILYPGFGNFAGKFGWTSIGQYDKEKAAADEQFTQAYGPLLNQDLMMVAADPKAREAGQRMFLTYCAQCHGSDAKGAKGFPNLTDSDWLYGGTPAQIEGTILNGRIGAMPPYGGNPDAIGGESGAREVANYVRSLSGLPNDNVLAARGKDKFAAVCSACHGPEGKGNQMIGAPNLTDKIWLYGSSEATIVETVTKGRTNQMPAHKDFLGTGKVHLLAAYVWGLGGGVKPEAVVAPQAPAADATPVTAVQ